MKLVQFNSSFTHLAKQAADKTLCGRPVSSDAVFVPASLRPVLDVCGKCEEVEKAEKEANS